MTRVVATASECCGTRVFREGHPQETPGCALAARPANWAACEADDVVRLAVVGAHLSGEPLNGQLTSRGATLMATTRTAAVYRLFALPTDPPKPGLLRVGDVAGAGAVEVEVWQLDAAAFGTFVDEIPTPLGIGRVLLADGTDAAGFLCEPIALEGATDITRHGGWRAYRAASPR